MTLKSNEKKKLKKNITRLFEVYAIDSELISKVSNALMITRVGD